MTYDVEAVRSHFPALAAGVAHFDSPGGTQVPDVVADAIRMTMLSPLANRGRVTAAEQATDGIVLAARQAIADLLGADPGGVVFGRSMTALTYELSRTLAKTWQPGDEVAVTRLDHDANIRPWVQAAESAGAAVRWIDFDRETSELTPEHVVAALSERTRLVAVTGASNLIGTRPDIAAISELVHQTKAQLFVDGVHLTAHTAPDMTAMGADYFACSPYKFLGPHHGVVAAEPSLLQSLQPDKLSPSTNDVPERFELGTLPYELLAGTTAAVDFLAGLAPTHSQSNRRAALVAAMKEVEAHEDRLRRLLEDGLAALSGTTVHSRATHRTPTLLLTFDDHPAAAAYQFLSDLGINAPSSSFYAIEASQRLGLGAAGGLRVGLACYNDDSDVERLLDGLARFLK